jgi:hypothetical protein
MKFELFHAVEDTFAQFAFVRQGDLLNGVDEAGANLGAVASCSSGFHMMLGREPAAEDLFTPSALIGNATRSNF